MSAVAIDDPFLRRELRGVRLLAARTAAGGLCGLALFLFVRGIPGALTRASERAQLANATGGFLAHPAAVISSTARKRRATVAAA